MGATRFIGNGIDAAEGAAEEAAEEAAEDEVSVPLRNNWVGPSPSVPVPPAGAGLKFLRGVKWFLTEAPIASRPYQIIINGGKQVELLLNSLFVATAQNVEAGILELGTDRVNEEDLKNRAKKAQYDGKFMLFANSVVDKKSLPILQRGMHMSTRAVQPSDARDSKSSYVYMTPNAVEHAIIYLEDSPSSGKKGLIIRVSKSSGSTNSDRYLAVGDETTDKVGKNQRRDSQSLYVYAHDDKKRAAVWEVSLFQKKHIVFRLVEAPTAGGTAFLSDATQDEKDYKGFYLTALEQYRSDSRPGGGVYMTVTREAKPVGFGVLIPHSDDLWWMDLKGDYDSFTIQESLHHSGLLMIFKEDNDKESYYSISPRQGSTELVVRRKGRMVATLTASRDGNGRVESVKLDALTEYLVLADYTVEGSFDSIEDARKYLMKNHAESPDRGIVQVKNGTGFILDRSTLTIGGSPVPADRFLINSPGKQRFIFGAVTRMNNVVKKYLNDQTQSVPFPFFHGNAYLVVDNARDWRSYGVRGSYGNIEDAKSHLMKRYPVGSRKSQRMIVEVKNGVITTDPHKIGGQNQGGGVAAGFNKFWWNRDFINTMNKAAKTYLDDNGGMVTTLTYNRKWWFDAIGMYENNVHPVKNPYHYVKVEADEDNENLVWNNRAIKWQLTPPPTSVSTSELTTVGSPYLPPRYDTKVTFVTDSFGEITGLIYLKELYKRVFWHEYIGKYHSVDSEPNHVFANVVMGNEQNKLLMQFEQEPMIALIPYDSEHFQVITSSGKKLAKATRDESPTSLHATLTLPDGRKFVRG